MSARFEIAKDAAGLFIFRLKASNGEQLLRSESYTTKASAQNGIASVKKNCKLDARYEKLTASNGQFYFNILAANYQIIATSELYTTHAAREHGIAVVKQLAPKVAIADATAAR